DSSADEKEKELIRRHLGECGSCREALAELEWIAEHLKNLPDTDPPAGLVPAIMAAVRSGSPPLPPPQPVYNPFSQGKWGLVALILTAVAFYWYLAPHKAGNGPEVKSPTSGEKAGAPSAAKSDRVEEEKGGGSLLPPLQERGGGGPAAGRTVPPRREAIVTPVPVTPSLPTVPPSGTVPVPPLPQQPVKPAKTAKPRVDASPALPSDWGESPPPGRTLPKKAVTRGRSDELSVLLGVTDHERAPGEIERTVTALGGSITGRGYSGGRDLLYIRIDVDKVMELMGRLGKFGTVLELPQIPEDDSGTIDLVIRW
ncbi:MAG TPA: hypothetical protein VFF53_08860, partial [Geobacteraceae bacterium]|nr:hypothetical protein [Geobacteraceae bacterium]